MRHVGAFATATLVAMVLAGCSESGAKDPATAPFEPVNDATFLAGLRKALPEGTDITDSQILELIDLSCTSLSHGTTGREIQESFIEAGESLSEVGTALRIVRIGVANYCPAHLSEFDFLVQK